MSYIRKEVIGPHTLYLGDCREMLPTLGKVDAVVTDPPYGIGADKHSEKNKGRYGWKYHGESNWDNKRPHSEIFHQMLQMSEYQIIWGGNYFTDLLPPTMQWLVWDKCNDGFSLADFELAWSSQKRAARIFRYARGNESGFAPRGADAPNAHPTQKPLGVMKWTLEKVPANAHTILDPFMGSGTTIVACQKLGRAGIGIEIDPGYFDIACRRVEEAMRQPDLFVQEPAPKPEQLDLMEAAE